MILPVPPAKMFALSRRVAVPQRISRCNSILFEVAGGFHSKKSPVSVMIKTHNPLNHDKAVTRHVTYFFKNNFSDDVTWLDCSVEYSRTPDSSFLKEIGRYLYTPLLARWLPKSAFIDARVPLECDGALLQGYCICRLFVVHGLSWYLTRLAPSAQKSTCLRSASATGLRDCCQQRALLMADPSEQRFPRPGRKNRRGSTAIVVSRYGGPPARLTRLTVARRLATRQVADVFICYWRHAL